jgi:methylphosphotriester-DNA--protein-cysteine methyltransferase
MMSSPASIDRSALRISSGVVDGALGRWRHSECRAPHLSGLVDFIWLFDGELTSIRERTFPNGLLEIIVHLGDRYGVVERDEVWICPATCLTGLQLQALTVEAPGRRTAVLGIRLTPMGAFALFGRVMPDVTVHTVDLEDLCGGNASRLAEWCRAAPRPESCLRAAVRWLEAQFIRAAAMDPAVSWAVAAIRRHHGAVPIAALQERTGFSRSRFVESFRAQVGTTPKQYARLIRFRHLLDNLPTWQLSLAAAAHDAGYYDQPHMNAEFKALSGFTPTEFLAARRYPNSVSVAE